MLNFLKELLTKWLNRKTKGKYSQVQRSYAKKQQTDKVSHYREVETVKVKKVIDGDTAWIKFNDGQEHKVRFLFIDTPEATKTVEKYGPEAAKFVYRTLMNAKKVEIEFDFERIDRHNRLLGWIWYTDNKGRRQLLQEEVARNGFVEKFYDYGNYKYENRVRKSLNDKYNIYQGRR